MHDTFLLPNTFLILSLWFLSLALFYFVVKVAVRNGVQQGHSGLIESVREIEKSVYEIKLATKKESS